MADILIMILVPVGLAQVGLLIRLAYVLAHTKAKVEIIERLLFKHLEK